MEKEMLETITQRLDRLEKTVAEMNQKLSALVEKPVPDVPMGPEARAKMRGAEALKNSKRDAHITEEILDKLFEQMGIPPDFDPGSIEELHESMRQHGIRAEDNEFSRAIIAEREK
ncbi:MAG: hypothetical protein OXN27_02430 [Candidatus Poribacteria bacterium]|nr:hypothetical protein [Candidatus Poribacteria bacterium]MDE0322754.1 hypothetical protein [Candidatus Poribacteria bacterium]